MRLDFVGMAIENFRRYIGPETSFPIADYGVGLHLFQGTHQAQPSLFANDVGKSTLWEALVWCLYGKTTRKLGNPDVKPWTGEKPTGVGLEIAVDGKPYSIVRKTDPNERYITGELVDQSAIDKLIGMGFETFTHSVILPQFGRLFFDLPKGEKLALFSEVLDLDRWDARSKLADTATIELQGKCDKVNNELFSKRNEITQIDFWIKDTRELIKEWEAERQQHMEVSDKKLAELNKEFNSIQDKHDAADLELDGAQTELRSINRQIRELRDARMTIESRQAHRKINNEREIAETQRELGVVGDATECPTCGQSLKGTGLAKHIDKLKQHIIFLKRQPKIWDLSKDNVEADKLNKQIAILEASESKFQQKADNAQSRLAIIAPHLGELRATIFEMQKMQNERQEVVCPHQKQLSALRRRKSTVYASIIELEKRLKILQRKTARTRHWVKGFKDVRLQVVEEVLQELQLATNLMLEDVGLIGWEVQYAIEKENKSGSVQRGLNVLILSPDNDKHVKWEVWGGGVSQRLRLVGALAFADVVLNRAGVQPSLEILDETTSFVADEAINDIITFLANRAKNLQKQIFFIDHTARQSTKFSSTITIIKNDRGSFLQ